jgi:hypothetical protein
MCSAKAFEKGTPPQKVLPKAELRGTYFKNALLRASFHLKYSTTAKIIFLLFFL